MPLSSSNPDQAHRTEPCIVAVMGPTSSGKSTLAESLASDLGAQLINADAFQVYRGLDIGTGKPTVKDRYLLLDLVEPNEQFGLGEWLRLAREAVVNLWSNGRSAVLVGGTGLYVRALFEQYANLQDSPAAELRLELMNLEQARGTGFMIEELRRLDPEGSALVDLKNPLRVRRALERAMSPSPSIETTLPPFRKIKLALNPPAETLRSRIDRRVSDMVASGWIEEVRQLRDHGVDREAPGMKAIGYRLVYDFLSGLMPWEDALNRIGIETARYAKRQRTWLRSEPSLAFLEWSDDPVAHQQQARALVGESWQRR